MGRTEVFAPFLKSAGGGSHRKSLAAACGSIESTDYGPPRSSLDETDLRSSHPDASRMSDARYPVPGDLYGEDPYWPRPLPELPGSDPTYGFLQMAVREIGAERVV